MRVYETELPGIGIRYRLEFDSGGELLVLTRNDGSRDVYWREQAESDSNRLFSLDADNARKLSDILEGTYFHPVRDGLEDVFEDARIKWIHIDAGSPLSGRTIGEIGVRSRTGITILGIRRGETMLAEVDAESRIEQDDVLVGVGTEESHDRFRSLLS